MTGKLSNPRVLRRFIILMGVATIVMFSVWAVIKAVKDDVPGDYEVRQGDIFLQDKLFEKAVERFNTALLKQPDHRGALGGKAAALISLERYQEAEDLLTYTIRYLTRTLEKDDPTGKGALSAAYANRGIIKDRQARYEEALKDYIQSINIDSDIADGPSWVEHLLYHNKKPSSVLARAEYIYKQLKLPEADRLLRVPEEDATQRMYKP